MYREKAARRESAQEKECLREKRYNPRRSPRADAPKLPFFPELPGIHSVCATAAELVGLHFPIFAQFFSIYSYFRHVQLYKLQREASQRIYLSSLMGRRGLTTVIIRGPDTSTPWDADLKSAQAEQEG